MLRRATACRRSRCEKPAADESGPSSGQRKKGIPCPGRRSHPHQRGFEPTLVPSASAENPGPMSALGGIPIKLQAQDPIPLAGEILLGGSIHPGITNPLPRARTRRIWIGPSRLPLDLLGPGRARPMRSHRKSL